MRTLEIFAGLTSILAITALILSLSVQNDRISTIQESRQRAADDSCILLRQLVVDATPQRQIKKAYAYLKAAGLENCGVYAAHIVRLP